MGVPNWQDNITAMMYSWICLLAILAPGYCQSNTAQLQNTVNGLASAVVTLQNRTINARTLAPLSNAVAKDIGAVSDHYLGSGEKCGPQTITGWTENVDWWREKDVIGTTKLFSTSTGIYTPVVAGYYHICAYGRFKNSGNAVEMCLRKGSTRIACFGNAVQYEWRSTGVCTNQLLSSTSDTVSLYLESGGSSDCIQETSWRYNRISVQLIQQSAEDKF